MLKFSDRDRLNIAIEDNLINLFKEVGKSNNYSIVGNESYSAVFHKNYAWPNFVFGINTQKTNIENLIFQIDLKIENKELPPFIISGPKSEKDSYEETFYQLNIRKIMEWPAMAIDLNQFSFAESDNLTVKRVENEKELESWLNIVGAELFKGEELHKETFLYFLSSNNILLFLGIKDGIAVSTSLLFLDNDVAGVYMIATSLKHRNKGHGKYMTNYVLNEAKKNDYQASVLQATPEGYPLYKKIGFNEFGVFNIYWKIGKSLK